MILEYYITCYRGRHRSGAATACCQWAGNPVGARGLAALLARRRRSSGRGRAGRAPGGQRQTRGGGGGRGGTRLLLLLRPRRRRRRWQACGLGDGGGPAPGLGRSGRRSELEDARRRAAARRRRRRAAPRSAPAPCLRPGR